MPRHEERPPTVHCLPTPMSSHLRAASVTTKASDRQRRGMRARCEMPSPTRPLHALASHELQKSKNTKSFTL